MTGCPKNSTESQNETDSAALEGAGPVIPTLNKEDLDKIGPKNNLSELVWMPSNGAYGYIMFPKRFFESTIGVAGNDILISELMNFTNIPVDFAKVETIIAVGRTKPVIIPPQPGGPNVSQQAQLALIVNCVKLTDPIERQVILSSFFPQNQTTPIKPRQVEGKDVYDLPAGFPLETNAIVFIDDKTFLYIREDDAVFNEILKGKGPTGPLAERMGRADLKNVDMIFQATAEGNPVIPPEISDIIASQYTFVPETLVKLIIENFRALQIRLDFSASESNALAQILFTTLKPEAAKDITRVLEDQSVLLKNTIAMQMASLEKKKEPNTPAAKPADDVTTEVKPETDAKVDELYTEQYYYKYATQALDAIEINFNESTVDIKLNHFAGFDTYVTEMFQQMRDQKKMFEEMSQTRVKYDQLFTQLGAIRKYMIKYHDEKGYFPPAAITNSEGTQLLSWRVAILPYMGQNDLYKQFKLDEPWDSEANRALIPRMPAIFADPRGVFDPTRTTIRVFDSPGTPFANPNLKMSDLATPSGTIMLTAVDSDNATEWTRPDSIKLGETPEYYEKLFGKDLPIINFGGACSLLPWSSNPEIFKMFEGFVKGEKTSEK
ncbi:MAG: DUF1559 domain-containing protein [Thermoguttaceae bacterium]